MRRAGRFEAKDFLTSGYARRFPYPAWSASASGPDLVALRSVSFQEFVELVRNNVLLSGLEHEGTHREAGILAAMLFGSGKNDGRLRASQGGVGLPRRKFDARGVPPDFHVRHVVCNVRNKIGSGDGRKAGDFSGNDFQAALPFLVERLLVILQIALEGLDHADDFFFADFLTAADRIFVWAVVEERIRDQIGSAE